MLSEYRRLDKARLHAMDERAVALDDVRRTEENMQATINSSWKQGSDTSGRNYYYNYVTGESSWMPPENWKSPHVDTWLRQLDERNNVYYFNMKTSESAWLPPCTVCGTSGERWCGDCGVAYCESDYERIHGEDAEPGFQDHVWSLTEYEKVVLLPGEIHCGECKRRACTVTCTTCWDNYCDVCFPYVHHAGALRFHQKISYKRSKQGWMCVKAKGQGENDFYRHGLTGETTYNKPEELMTVDELIYYRNFLSHKEAAEKHAQRIDELQFELETANYERDSILMKALESGANLTDILGKRRKKKAVAADGEEVREDVVVATIKRNKPTFWSLVFGDKTEHRNTLLRPNARRRGQARSDFIKNLIESVDDPDKNKKK